MTTTTAPTNDNHTRVANAQLEQLLQLQRDILAMIVSEQDSDRILAELCLLSEAMLPNSVASVMLYDITHHHLNVRTAPNIPAAGIAVLNGLEPGPAAGSCGTAVYTQAPVFVENTRTDPRWASLRQLAEDFDLGACWSMPIVGRDQQILGSFALSSFEQRQPRPFHRRLLETGAHLAGIVLQRQTQDEFLQLAATAFANITEGIMITDADQHIVEVNAAFTEITGYSPGDIIGRTPRILSSGLEGSDFFHAMWQALGSDGRWSGELRNRRHNGEIYPQWLSIRAIRDAAGQPTHYVAVLADISQVKQTEHKLWYLAHHDALTDLPNRLFLHGRLEHAIKHAKRVHAGLALMFIDLDNFKYVNDSLGHRAGDEVLRGAARRLTDTLRQDDTVARLGGDEFVILIEGADEALEIRHIADKLLHAFATPFRLGTQDFLVTPSIGISRYPDDGQDGETLLQNADTAMYEAKRQGRNGIAYYAPAQTLAVQRRVTLEGELRRALEREEFVLHFQPQYRSASQRLAGAEVLVRWQHPDGRLIPPAEFIPIAEEIGLIRPLGCWITEQACSQASAWRRAGLAPFRLSINLSPHQLQETCADVLADILTRTGFPAADLELEITESLLLKQGSTAIIQLGRLQALGLRLSMDDFGTGHSSLSQLKLLPIHRLKIDRSFVRDLTDDPNDATIVRAIIALGHALGLQVTAEGVETPAQLALLTHERCDEYQGYLFSRPLPAHEFVTLLS